MHGRDKLKFVVHEEKMAAIEESVRFAFAVFREQTEFMKKVSIHYCSV
jgi:hypothetical protein